MTAVGAATGDIVYDMLLSMGISVLVWLCYHLTCGALPKKRLLLLQLAAHLVFFAAAGFFIFCFILGVTTSKAIRWHMIFGFALGAWIYFYFFAQYVTLLLGLIKRLIRLILYPFRLLWKTVSSAVSKRVKDALQKARLRRYTRMEARRKKKERKRRAKNAALQNEKKEPLKAYHQS